MRIAAIPVATALLLTACGDSAVSACDDVVFEELHPQSAVHVITDDDVTYLTDPPTSGPHASSRVPDSGVVAPLPPSVQVAVLEGGGVIVQYQPQALTDADADALADAGLVVFERADLADPVVATAWQQKLTCTSFDADVVLAFRDEHGGDGTPHG